MAVFDQLGLFIIQDAIPDHVQDRIDASISTSLSDTPLVNSDKCCAGTRDSTNGDFCYIVRRPTSSNGYGLAIETYYGNSNRLNKGATIALNVPFRMVISDAGLLNDLSFTSQPQSAGNLLWNPGLTVSGGKLSPKLEVPKNWYEINMTRAQLQRLRNKKILLYNNFSPISNQYVEASAINTHVLDPKIMVDHNGTTDYITVAFNSRVEITGRYFYKENRTETTMSNSTIYWTVPFVLRFAVTKSTLKTESLVNVNNYWWTYGINPATSQNNITSINGLGGTITTKSYDFNIIPHGSWSGTTTTGRSDEVYRTGSTYSAYRPRYGQWPVSFGSKVDIASDRTRSETIVAGSLGFYNESDRKFRTYTNISRLDLSGTAGYKSPTLTLLAPYSPIDLAAITSRVAVAINGNTLLVAVTREPGNSSSLNGSTVFTLYNLAAGMVSDGFYSRFNQTLDTIVVPYNNGFCASFLEANSTLGALTFFPQSVVRTGDYNPFVSLPNGAFHLRFVKAQVLNSHIDRYTPFTNEQRYYISRSRNKEIFGSITSDKDKTTALIPRPLASGSIAWDIPRSASAISSKVYTVPATGLAEHIINVDHNIYTINDDNEDREDDHFYIKHKSSNTYWVTDEVRSYKLQPLEISGSTIQPEYWVNPEFAESEADAESLGVRLIISLLNCSGLYTAGDISGGDAWDTTARPAATYAGGVIHGGIPLDPSRTRNDIDYTYYGTEIGYQRQQPPYGTNSLGETRFGGSYTLKLENDADVQLTYKGYNILADTDQNGVLKVKPVCWKYNQSGLFNMYLDVYLNLDGIVGDDSTSQFTDDGFEMSNCKLTVTLKNRHGYPISRFTERTFDITPPSASGFVNSNVGYKTLNDVTFDMFRDINPASLTFTTMRNVRYHWYDWSENDNQSYLNTPSDFYETSNQGASYNTTLTFDPNLNFEKGDYVYVSYEPRLNDSRAKAGIIENSVKVSNVLGHRFNIDNVLIEFRGDNGAYSDVTNSIDAGGIIYYSGISDLDVRVSYDCSSESWPGRSELSDYQIYPYIKNMYLFASAGAATPVSSTTFLTGGYEGEQVTVQYEAVPPIIRTPATYPNHTEAFGTALKGRYSYMNSNYPAMTDVITPGDTTLTSFVAGTYNHEITIDDPGEYQLYLIIEDEFDQRSCFCLTNISNNYKIPFRRV